MRGPTTTWLVTVTLVAMQAGPLEARSPQLACKKIREAVVAGHTLEQIIAEFDTDAEQVMRCTQKRGRRRAAPKARPKKPTKPAAKPHKEAGATGGKPATESAPHAKRPASLRVAPHPVP